MTKEEYMQQFLEEATKEIYGTINAPSSGVGVLYHALEKACEVLETIDELLDD